VKNEGSKIHNLLLEENDGAELHGSNFTGGIFMHFETDPPNPNPIYKDRGPKRRGLLKTKLSKTTSRCIVVQDGILTRNDNCVLEEAFHGN
jgi:hypothetical protein